MKMTDGTFQQIFESMAKQYPDILTNHEIVDIATAHVAARPQKYDVIVTLNLYGDIMSDVAAEVAGSVGLAGSANVGSRSGMFEAIHGSAPDIAGKDIANPSGMLNGAIMMLNYLGQHDVATKIHNATLAAMEVCLSAQKKDVAVYMFFLGGHSHGRFEERFDDSVGGHKGLCLGCHRATGQEAGEAHSSSSKFHFFPPPPFFLMTRNTG
jgi:isocitrate dehydrogenase